jgi:cyclopropane-fatty-acyl-phospholipid synthase
MNCNEQTCASCREAGTPVPGILSRLARGLLLKSLSTVTHGRIIIVENEERLEFGDPQSKLVAAVRVHHPEFYRRVAFGGTIGAGESYMDGLWECDDLVALARIMVRNQESQAKLESGLARLTAPLQRLLHRLNDNTRRGSRSNIAAHYDLGNDFYQLFLDPTMAYSCGIFEHRDSSMEDASIAKLERICRKLRLAPGMSLLEIGAGWGGFAIHAARNYGCRVTTTTISQQQHDLARERIAAAGVSGRVTLLQQDYRDLTGRFDRLVSIEMIEAVGHRHLPTFFQVCGERLKPDGAALIQAITVPDHIYDRYKDTPDFINRHIFPGGCCPSLQVMTEACTRQSDLRLVHLEDFTPHYARTLREWRLAFLASLEQVRKLGYPERFIRMWEYYLCYCEGAFEERFTGNLQLLLNKPQCRLEPLLPPLGET